MDLEQQEIQGYNIVENIEQQRMKSFGQILLYSPQRQ